MKVKALTQVRGIAERQGTFPSEGDFDLVIGAGRTEVLRPDGSFLLTYIPEALTEEAVAEAYPHLRALRNKYNNNRGLYGGGVRFRRVLKDGRIGRTTYAANEEGSIKGVRSIVLGYMDRNPRIPFCRETVYTSKHPEDWGHVIPMLMEAGAVMKKEQPERWLKQWTAAKKTHPSYVIPGTPFTTITVNSTLAGTLHQDKGDFKAGCGAMAVIRRRGEYEGGLLVFPEWRIAVDMKDRDLILFDAHEWHANTKIVAEGKAGEDYERISVVMYFREHMTDCLPPPEELRRARSGKKTVADEDVS